MWWYTPTQEAEAGHLLVRGQPGLWGEFQHSQGYTGLHTLSQKPLPPKKLILDQRMQSLLLKYLVDTFSGKLYEEVYCVGS